MLWDSIDLAEDGVKGMFQRTVEGIALSSTQLFKVARDALSRDKAALAVVALDVARDLLPRQDGLGDLVERGHESHYIITIRSRTLASVAAFMR